ncbi:serine/threonine-protein phosphatase 4 regulatory subunit 2 [Gastrophryne carolinensis]
MDVDRLLEALKEFEKKGKKEVHPELDQFLGHVAKTGETIVQWPQFKDYFMFKLEKVMDDFRSSAPEPRGPPNPNVEYIPFDEMKERILKIVTGFNGTPFTIQRLCELVTDPRRNYTGTDKFLRGVEKNVMVVSCVYPSSEKNNSSSRMNGVMFPGNSQNYTDRSNINGPGTPRPLSKPKLSLSSPTTANGLPDNAETKDADVKEKPHSDSLSPDESSPSSTVKNKHTEEEPAEEHEVKRLKFDTEDEEVEQPVQEDPSTDEISSEMTNESEVVSTSEEAESPDTEHAAEEASMTASECTPETSDKPTSEPETVSVTSSEESHEMEESGQCEADGELPNEEEEAATAECATSTSKADGERSDAEPSGTFENSPEIPAESPMENSEEATDVADEPMEQD